MYIKIQRWYNSIHMLQEKPPKLSSEKRTHTKFPSQAGEGDLVKWLGENVCKLVLGRNVGKLNISFLHMISQKVVPHFYVFGFGMKHGIFGYAYGTGAITKKWNMGHV